MLGRRGPPPRQLAKLCSLLVENPYLTDQELAEKLGVTPSSVKRYKRRLKKLVRKNRTSFCPECLQPSVIYDPEQGEYVCTKCGLVLDYQAFLNSLPFGTEEQPNTFALVHPFTFGKSLGETVHRKYRYRVIAKVSQENGKPDEVPVRQIQVITEMIDPPLMKNMLNYGSYLLKELGYDRDMVKNHILADYYGRLLRKLAVYLMDKKLSVPPNQVVHAALFYLLTKTDMKKAQEMLKKFPFDKKYLRIVALVANLALI